MTFADLVSEYLLKIINLAIPVIFALTLVFVFWKIIRAWIIGAADPQSVESGRNTALVAVIALAVMIGVWGLVSILQSSLGLR